MHVVHTSDRFEMKSLEGRKKVFTLTNPDIFFSDIFF